MDLLAINSLSRWVEHSRLLSQALLEAQLDAGFTSSAQVAKNTSAAVAESLRPSTIGKESEFTCQVIVLCPARPSAGLVCWSRRRECCTYVKGLVPGAPPLLQPCSVNATAPWMSLNVHGFSRMPTPTDSLVQSRSRFFSKDISSLLSLASARMERTLLPEDLKCPACSLGCSWEFVLL